MSEKAARRTLFVAGLLLVPFPVLLLGPGLVPPARHLLLGLVGYTLAVAEGASPVGLTISTAFVLQALAYGLVVWLGAWVLARGLAQLAPHTRLRLTLLTVMVAAGLAFSQPVYHTPFSAKTAHSNLLELYW